jgi:hypothetical protein
MVRPRKATAADEKRIAQHRKKAKEQLLKESPGSLPVQDPDIPFSFK